MSDNNNKTKKSHRKFKLHGSRDKMADIFQTTFFNYFSWNNSFYFDWTPSEINCSKISVDNKTGHLFTKREVSKPRDELLWLCYNDRIALKFDKHISSTPAEVPIRTVETLISRLGVFMRSCSKTSVRLMNKGPALVHIMTWCRTSDKSLFEPIIVLFTDAYIRRSPSMS